MSATARVRIPMWSVSASTVRRPLSGRAVANSRSSLAAEINSSRSPINASTGAGSAASRWLAGCSENSRRSRERS